MLTPDEIGMFKKILNDHRFIPKFLVCGSKIFNKLQEISEEDKVKILGNIKFFQGEDLKPDEVMMGCQHSDTWHPIYDEKGYDELGYNKEGYNRQGFKRY